MEWSEMWHKTPKWCRKEKMEHSELEHFEVNRNIEKKLLKY